MATAAEKARAKAERLASRRTTATETGHQEQKRPATPAPAATPAAADAKPVRLTVDMAPPLHDAFDDWARDAARTHRFGRSIKADVMRELVRRLLNDPEAQAAVIESLTEARRK